MLFNAAGRFGNSSKPCAKSWPTLWECGEIMETRVVLILVNKGHNPGVKNLRTGVSPVTPEHLQRNSQAVVARLAP